jgi:creatinine amidohydrolase
VPVLPVLPYGLTGFTAFPGSPTLRLATYCGVLRDLLDSLCAQGFRRLLLVNGHGGNTPARAAVVEWAVANRDARVVWHELWDGRADEVAAEIDPEYDHASWSENLPWTRLEGVELPRDRKAPIVPPPAIASPEAWREALGDGSFGGPYQVPDEDVLRVWAAAVEELRSRLESLT